MYAVIEVGSKQYSVKKDDVLEVEKQGVEKGVDLAIEKVLLVADGDTVEIGKPYVQGAKVIARVMGETRGEKLISYKYRRRKASHWKKGHRQDLTRIKITEIAV